MKHTPTPWGFGDREGDAICMEGGRSAVIHRPRSKVEFGRYDLEYIVHCVNNHADMLEALEQVVYNWEYQKKTGGKYFTSAPTEYEWKQKVDKETHTMVDKAMKAAHAEVEFLKSLMEKQK